MTDHKSLDILQQALQQNGVTSQPLIVAGAVAGGSINHCCRLRAGNEPFFLKWNAANAYPYMLQLEAQGLELIRNAGAVNVPQVVAQGQTEQHQYLLLRWIEKGTNTIAAQQKLGRQLAALHQTKGNSFGLHYNNYMGSLTQQNEPETDCAAFFWNKRLQPQLRMAVDNRLIDSRLIAKLETLAGRLSELIPPEAPSLTHGDLWSGNYMIDTAGNPVLIDPAVAYHHRETDIALTTLFGGFAPAFYQAYNEACALQPGWQQRTDLWNIYPLLIHVNLFGHSYVSQLQECVDQFV